MTTDEAESVHKKQVCEQQQEEEDPAAQEPGPADTAQDSPSGTSPPPGGSEEEQQLKPRQRTSTGRGLSRLFSSFLKRRSQCSEGEGVETERAREKNSQEEPKAPIADPEPELRIEGDVALDQHSVSSAENQQIVADQKEDAELESVKEEGEKEEEKQEENMVEEEEEEEEEGKKQKASRRPRIMHCKVKLLDDSLFECELEKHAKGQDLFAKVCDHLNLLEKDYYGLAIWETPTIKTWLDFTKEIRRQVQGEYNYDFTFNVKFYPPDPAQLSEDITRYYLCLQLRKDIKNGCLPCSFVTLALLGSYALQSELGEYDPEVHGTDYAKELQLIPGQTKELEEKVMELHRTYRSMSPAQADMMFLENAKKLAMYGVDLHQAKDLDGVDIMLGVCSSGLMVYKDKLRINRFPWPKVLKVSYKRSSFFIKIRPSDLEHYESAIGFKLPNYKAAKKLWKVCVEHHTFFRLTSTEAATTPRKFLALGSKFRYSGRTQAQTRQASSVIDRPAPHFQRSASKRASRSLDGGVSAVILLVYTLFRLTALDIPLTISNFATPCQLAVQDQTLKMTQESFYDFLYVQTLPTLFFSCFSQKRAKKFEGEAIYIRHSNLMLEDVDKTQTQIMRHHTSISELKRSFMESVPEPRPSEWDKRLSTHSPFRTASFNGQLQPDVSTGSPVVKTKTITISDVTNSLRSEIASKDIPIVHTETKTITYESAQVSRGESGMLLSAQTITSETVSTTTTTQITKTVKGGISETRIEKRIVITGDTEIDHDKALAQAIKEAKEQHPDMSVTKVVVHQETEITPE
uniref:Protein 4.1 n=1 Tax=Sinocyclocheilus grahami TaxID=75366 RepID=A0A672Q9G5_SINGR